jgi:hypothetical protein
VRQFDNLTPPTIDAIRQRYNRGILAPAAYWDARRNCRFAVLIWLGPLVRQALRRPVPRQYGTGWLLLAP